MTAAASAELAVLEESARLPALLAALDGMAAKAKA